MEHQNVRAHVIVTGRVQGVAFRFEACRAAERIGVVGWVRNRRDGSVEAVIEGEKARVEEMLAWCRKGPLTARVDDVAVAWQPGTGEFTKFVIAF